MDEELKEKLVVWFTGKDMDNIGMAGRLLTFLGEEGYVVVKKDEAEYLDMLRKPSDERRKEIATLKAKRKEERDG